MNCLLGKKNSSIVQYFNLLLKQKLLKKKFEVYFISLLTLTGQQKSHGYTIYKLKDNSFSSILNLKSASLIKDGFQIYNKWLVLIVTWWMSRVMNQSRLQIKLKKKFNMKNNTKFFFFKKYTFIESTFKLILTKSVVTVNFFTYFLSQHNLIL